MPSLSAVHMQILYVKTFLGEYFCALIIFLAYFTLACVFKLFLSRFQEKFGGSGKSAWHDFFKSLSSPLFFFFIFKGIVSAVSEVGFIHMLIKSYIPIVNKALLFFVVYWFLISYLTTYQRRLPGSINKKIIKISSNVVKFAAVFLAITFSMDVLGVDIRGILTVTGIGGAAIGFASKDLIANFFGSIIIFMDKPFSVGDWIKLSNDKEGKVEHIGWRVTKIRTRETSCIYIANSFFSNILIENYSKVTHRNISKTIILKCLDMQKLTTVMGKIRDMLSKHADIDNSKEIDCFICEFKEDSVKCKINAFTTITERFKFLQLEQQIMFEIAKITNKHKLHMTISN